MKELLLTISLGTAMSAVHVLLTLFAYSTERFKKLFRC